MRTFGAKDLLVGLVVILGLIGVALVYGYIVWHSFNKPTFLSVKAGSCRELVNIRDESKISLQEKLFGSSCN